MVGPGGRGLVHQVGEGVESPSVVDPPPHSPPGRGGGSPWLTGNDPRPPRQVGKSAETPEGGVNKRSPEGGSLESTGESVEPRGVGSTDQGRQGKSIPSSRVGTEEALGAAIPSVKRQRYTVVCRKVE